MSGLPFCEVDRLPNDATSEFFFENYYKKARPCVIPAVARGWPASEKWDMATVQGIVSSHVDMETVELVQPRAEADAGGGNGCHYSDLSLGSIAEYFGYLRAVSSGAGGAPGVQKASLKNGINVPRKVIAEDCPVPELLAELHRRSRIRLRDMMGRRTSRLFISSKGFHGRCHFDRFGYAFFSVQVKGAKRWFLYGANSLPLARSEAFDNAPTEDFTREEVQRRYGAAAASVGPGDMLFLPPYTYHSVLHEGEWNVHLDYACLPDEVWASHNRELPLALQDIAGMLGSRILLCYGLPTLLGDRQRAALLQADLMAGAFEEDEAVLAQRALIAKGGADVERALRSAVLSASGAGMAALVLESCIACSAAMPTPYALFAALAILGYQLQELSSAEGLIENVELVKSQVLAGTIAYGGPAPASGAAGSQALEREARRALADAAAWTARPPSECEPASGDEELPDGPVERMVLSLATAFDRMRSAPGTAGGSPDPAPHESGGGAEAANAAGVAEGAEQCPAAPTPTEPKPSLEKHPRGVLCAWQGCPTREPLREFSACGRCGRAVYCSEQCQAAHWEASHSAECRAPEALEAKAKEPAEGAPEAEEEEEQPALPDLKIPTPFAEEKLCGLMPELRAWVLHLARHFTAPRPKGQPEVTLPAAFVLREEESTGFIRPVVCEMQTEPSAMTVCTRWALTDNNGVAVFVLAPVRKGTKLAKGEWLLGSGVLVQICSSRTNLAFFLEGEASRQLQPAVDYPADNTGPLLLIEQLETAFTGTLNQWILSN